MLPFTNTMIRSPFDPGFTNVPPLFIQSKQTRAVVDAPVHQFMLVRGLRGSGKSVALTNNYNVHKDDDKVVVLDSVNSEDESYSWRVLRIADDLFEELGHYNKFSDYQKHNSVLKPLKTSWGISYEKNDSKAESILEALLDFCKQQNIQVDVQIDEAWPNKYLTKLLVKFHDDWITKYPVAVILADIDPGFEKMLKIDELSFLHDAKVVRMWSLNQTTMMWYYQYYLHLNASDAMYLTKLSGGYAYGFQLVGQCAWSYLMQYHQPLKFVLKDVERHYREQLEFATLQPTFYDQPKIRKLVLKLFHNVDYFGPGLRFGQLMKQQRKDWNLKPEVVKKVLDKLIEYNLVKKPTPDIYNLTLPYFGEYVNNASLEPIEW